MMMIYRQNCVYWNERKTSETDREHRITGGIVGSEATWSQSISINIGLLKDGKTHLRTNVSEKITKYMTMYDKIKSVRIGEFHTAEKVKCQYRFLHNRRSYYSACNQSSKVGFCRGVAVSDNNLLCWDRVAVDITRVSGCVRCVQTVHQHWSV